MVLLTFTGHGNESTPKFSSSGDFTVTCSPCVSSSRRTLLTTTESVRTPEAIVLLSRGLSSSRAARISR